jgi:RNA polymerase subunit RPABC4/transcription elongation factor Spt4
MTAAPLQPDERNCPGCQQTIKAEATVCRFCGRSFDEQEQGPSLRAPTPSVVSKRCPRCAELIRSDAKVCRVCGHDLRPVDPVIETEPPDAASTPTGMSDRKKLWLSILGVFLFLGTIGAITNPSNGSRTGASPSSEQSSQKLEELYRQVQVGGNPCDDASSDAADALTEIGEGRGSLSSARRLVRQAREACRSASTHMNGLVVPAALSSEHRAGAAEAVSQCQLAYQARAHAWETVASIFGGARDAATMERFQQQAAVGTNALGACVFGLTTVIEATGGTVPGGG